MVVVNNSSVTQESKSRVLFTIRMSIFTLEPNACQRSGILRKDWCSKIVVARFRFLKRIATK